MKTGRDYIVFPLDFASTDDAKAHIRLLSEHVGMFKVGLELFIRSGPPLIDFIKQDCSAKIFLDLKLHDIPVTVSRAMSAIAALGVDFATVHCGENPDMLTAAVAGAGQKVNVLGVTVLTSVDGEHIRAAGFKNSFAENIRYLVLKRAKTAQAAGVAGVICSGLEVADIKADCGASFLALTPGIRPDWPEAGRQDQQRITTPAEAIKRGADYLVIGRPIRDARDPVAAAKRVADEIDAVLTRPGE